MIERAVSTCIFLFAGLLCGAADFIPAGKDVEPAVLVVPVENKADFTTAAKDMQKYVKLITGTELEIVPSSEGKRIEFAVSKDMDTESFSVTFPQEEVLRLTAGSPRALSYAVFELLERYGKCRWLLPGPLGEIVPRSSQLVFPAQPISETAAFRVRSIGIVWNTWQQKYCHLWFRQIRRNSEPVKFIHNTQNLFDPKVFVESNPEFYPVFKDKRFNPLLEPKISWQPCFTAPGLPEAAAKRICEYFEKTGQRTYSLGMHDTIAFCECERCLAMDSRRLNECQYEDRTNSYFSFCNKVAELVTQKYPDAKLGFLAYDNLMEPPPMEIHPALMPFITYDRMYWLVPEKKKYDQELTEAWGKKLPDIAWYDYTYGKHYIMPRMYLRLMQQYMKWAKEHGVRHYYAEHGLTEDFHEGPKFYIMAKLLWNPDIDLEAVLDDWYLNAVGPKAAPYLKEYYDRLEDFWAKRVSETDFFRMKFIYLDFTSSEYLDTYTMEDVDRSAWLMEQVRKYSDNKERGELFYNAFKKRENIYRSHIRNREVFLNREKYDFNTVLLKDDFSKGIPASWQSTNGKFIHSPDEGIGSTPAAGFSFAGSRMQTMSYLVFPDAGDKEFFKATVKYKVVGIDPQIEQRHPRHFDSAKVSLSISWQGSSASDPYSSSIKWLPMETEVKTWGEVVSDGEWRTMTVYARRPLLPVTRMVVLMEARRCSQGYVYFDDLEVTAADAPHTEKDGENTLK